EPQTGDLANANAIEQHVTAHLQSRHRTVEDHPVGDSLLLTGGMMQPEDEAKCARDHGEREQPDQVVVRCSLHHSTPSVPARSFRTCSGAYAVEIGLHPWVLRCQHRSHGTGFNDLALAENSDPVADRMQAVEVMGYHKNRHRRNLL